MARSYIPDAPAEVERLAALAGATLSDAGVDDARRDGALYRGPRSVRAS